MGPAAPVEAAAMTGGAAPSPFEALASSYDERFTCSIIGARMRAAVRRRLDGAFSNFGALNCVPDLAPVSAGLARLVRPGGRVLLCFLGRWVPWEWGWFLSRGRRDSAFRRLATGGAEWRGLCVSYPTLRGLKRTFAPGFRCSSARAVGVFLPPSYAEAWAARHPHLLGAFDALERRVEAIPPFPSLADHVLLELERR